MEKKIKLGKSFKRIACILSKFQRTFHYSDARLSADLYANITIGSESFLSHPFLLLQSLCVSSTNEIYVGRYWPSDFFFLTQIERNCKWKINWDAAQHISSCDAMLTKKKKRYRDIDIDIESTTTATATTSDNDKEIGYDMWNWMSSLWMIQMKFWLYMQIEGHIPQPDVWQSWHDTMMKMERSRIFEYFFRHFRTHFDQCQRCCLTITRLLHKRVSNQALFCLYVPACARICMQIGMILTMNV